MPEPREVLLSLYQREREAEEDGGGESTEDDELEPLDVELDLIQLPKSTLAALKQGNRPGARTHTQIILA